MMSERTPDNPSGTSRNQPWVDKEGLTEVLRGLRERAGLTQKEVADLAGISPSAITRLESGSRRPGHEMLRKLAAVFGTSHKGLVAAAERVAQGEELEAVLDDLPAATVSSVPSPAAMAADHTSVSAPPPAAAMLAPPPLTGPRLQALALAEQLEALEDPSGAVALLREAIEWLVERGGSSADVDRLRRELQELLRGSEQGREPVAAMPTGEVRYVFKHALGRDKRRQIWIDPLARARVGGLDHEDPRVERYDSGEIVVDLERLDDKEFGPREADRHRVKVTVEGDADSSEPEPDVESLEQVYAETVIEIHWPDRPHQIVEPRPEGVTEGDFPDGVDHIHVITAFNPRSRLLRRSENEERNRMLRADLDRAGLRYVGALGRSPDSSWSEDSFAVIDADPEQVLDLASRYQQNAFFAWTRRHRMIVWGDGEQLGSPRGWHAHSST
jgi:transcriptional regulator with XRE-family HTH domain